MKVKTRLAMLLAAVICFSSIAACSKKAPEKTSNDTVQPAPAVPTAPAPTTVSPSSAGSTPSALPAASPATSGSVAPLALMSPLEWPTVPESTADIGNYPYFKAPEGIQVVDEYGKLSKKGFTSESAFVKRYFFSENRFFSVEGKVSQLNFSMANGSQNFESELFNRNYEVYLESIGAKLLFKGKIASERLDELNSKEGVTQAEFLQGAWRGSTPIRIYALNKANKKMIVQFYSNSAGGTLAFVELNDLKLTVSKYTALGMQKDIESSGKAILDITFDTGKSSLKPEGLQVVAQITAMLKNNPAFKLSIEGHTDNVGVAASNKLLSDERAKAVMQLLISNGISKEALRAVGLGSDKPLVPNDSDANQAKNRRVELVKF